MKFRSLLEVLVGICIILVFIFPILHTLLPLLLVCVLGFVFFLRSRSLSHPTLLGASLLLLGLYAFLRITVFLFSDIHFDLNIIDMIALPLCTLGILIGYGRVHQ